MSNAPVSATPAVIHPWEAAGLGKAPFRWLGCEVKVGPIRIANADGTTTEIGAQGQPMGSCAYCFQGIAECHAIKSADGKVFTVGCDCVRRVYATDADFGLADRVLAKVENASKKLRNEKARARHAAKAATSETELAELLADETVRGKLAARPSAQAWKAEQGATELDDVEWLAPKCGHAGRVKLIARIKAATA